MWITTEVDVEIDLSEFSDGDLIKELSNRCYEVRKKVDVDLYDLYKITEENITFILDLLDSQNFAPGTMGWDIYEKLRKR